MIWSPKSKQIIAILLCLAIVAGSVSALAETRKIRSGSMVRLREAPSTKAKVLDAFPKGTKVNVLKKGPSWCKIRVNKLTGYMMTKYLYNPSEITGDEVTGEGQVMYVWTPSGTRLNLREGPSKSTPVIDAYRVGTKVIVLKKGKSWTKVSVKGKVGYMGSEYLVATKTK